MPIWFQVHRTLMSIIPGISLAAFLVILSDLNWKWVSTETPLNFAHSITGIITISLPFLQIGVALLRPHPGTPRRPYFNYFHRSLGILIFVLSGKNELKLMINV